MAIAISLGIKVPLFVPIVYAISYWRKDAFSVAFLFYSLLLGYEFTIESIYSFDIATLSILFSTLMLLEEGLNIRKRVNYFLSPFALVGIFSLEFLTGLLTFTLLYSFYSERPSRGWVAFSFLILLIVVFLVFRQLLDYEGSSPTQAIVIAAIAAFASLLWIRRAN